MPEPLFKTLHAIQLVTIETRELYIRLNAALEDDFESLCKENIEIVSAHSDFIKDENKIHVGLRLSLGMDSETPLPVSMRIEIAGTFSVDTEEFSEDNIEAWANNNAPYILYPFMRENSYALAIRCGIPPLVLPMIQVPTLTMNGKEQ